MHAFVFGDEIAPLCQWQKSTDVSNRESRERERRPSTGSGLEIGQGKKEINLYTKRPP